MKTYTAVRERLLQLLESRKFSVHKLALDSGVSPSTIKNILYSKSVNPGVVTIKMLCDGFGITIAEFFECELFDNLDD
ncbi:MAG TPA: helix-turn-helix transcriptional regulator [Candidatus Coproplasma avistercoris]|nr:helix-turn-helix transcriptional regulator [Candidatus Coproplasma avistercoris]